MPASTERTPCEALGARGAKIAEQVDGCSNCSVPTKRNRKSFILGFLSMRGNVQFLSADLFVGDLQSSGGGQTRHVDSGTVRDIGV